MDSNRKVNEKVNFAKALYLCDCNCLNLLMLGSCYFRSYVAFTTEKVSYTLIATFTILVAKMWLRYCEYTLLLNLAGQCCLV